MVSEKERVEDLLMAREVTTRNVLKGRERLIPAVYLGAKLTHKHVHSPFQHLSLHRQVVSKVQEQQVAHVLDLDKRPTDDKSNKSSIKHRERGVVVIVMSCPLVVIRWVWKTFRR